MEEISLRPSSSSIKALEEGQRKRKQPLFFFQKLEATIEAKAEEVFATWYDKNGTATEEYTFAQVWKDAGTIAYHLRHEWGCEKGDRVVLVYLFGLHFFAAFLGCLRAGVVAVLVYPPGPPLVKSLSKLQTVIKDCKPVLMLADTTVNVVRNADGLNPFSKSRHLWPEDLPVQVTDSLTMGRTKAGKYLSNIASAILKRDGKQFQEPESKPEDVAFLQYTSGSTGDPKGVAVTFASLWANVTLIADDTHNKLEISGGIPSPVVQFSWLPQYHDAGLILAYVIPFAYGWRQHFISPLDFLGRPLLWIELLAKTRANVAMAPDFAYRLAARKYQEAKVKKGASPFGQLDLSAIRGMANAAEPVRTDTRKLFLDAFQEHNLPETYFHAAYGLAESVVGVSFVHKYHLSTPRHTNDKPLVACGCRRDFHPSVIVKVVDPETCLERKDGRTGEIWVGGPSTRNSYYNKEELSKKTFQARLANDTSNQQYLRTGDLGFFQDDYLYICGRIKDLIIINGANQVPQDIEYVVQDASPFIRPGCVAAFSANETDNDGTIEVVFEVRPEGKDQAGDICRAVRSLVAQNIGIAPSRIVAIQQRTIPKTTSGKIRRRATRDQLHRDELAVLFDLKSIGRLQDDSRCPGSLRLSNTESSTSERHDLEDPESLKSSEKYDDIIAEVLGEQIDPSLSWIDSGLSSMAVVELTNKLSTAFPVSMPPDFLEKYETPAALKAFIMSSSSGAFFPTILTDLDASGMLNTTIPWLLSGAFQGLGVAMLFLVLATSVLPAYHFVSLCGNIGTVWSMALLPLVLPVWHTSFSLLVILAKYLVIGFYSERKVSVPSIYFLRWWFVDRLVHTWEFFTGRFLRSTPLLWLFYRVMGAQISARANIDGFIREFDLVSISDSVSLEFDLNCRVFGLERKECADAASIPSLRFRSTKIEANCKIRGHVGAGANVGQGSSVEKLAAVPEGAQVPNGSTAVASPAFHGPEPSTENTTSTWFHAIGLTKVLWIFCELYISAVFVWVGEQVFGDILKENSWRYRPIFQVATLLAFSTGCGLFACIPLKWLLIGRRRPNRETSDVSSLLHWIVDYHFEIYRSLFDLVAENTLFVNVFLMALGMDIDLKSKVWLFVLPPSKVDLIRIKRSMVSAASFDVGSDGKPIVIEDSSIGHSIALTGGCTIRNAEILPFTRVTTDVTGDKNMWKSQKPLLSVPQRLLVDCAAVPSLLVMTASFIPTYEFFQLAVLNSKSVPLLQFPVWKLASALLVHCAVWYVICFLLHRIVYINVSSKVKNGAASTTPWSPTLFAVYLAVMTNFWELSFLSLSWGSPFINVALAGLGCRIRGELWYFGRRLYDAPLISISGPAVVDSSWLNGHSVVYGRAELASCQTSGLLHPYSVCLAHTDMTTHKVPLEVGPMRFVSPTRASSIGLE